MLRRNFLYVSLLALSFAVVSCTQNTSDNSTSGSSNTANVASEPGSELIMGLIPAENMRKWWKSLSLCALTWQRN